MKETAEQKRLNQNYSREKYWLKWGPYLSERQWGTVREDYSEHGTAWEYFPHDHARSRTYRWGEDGIAGICDTRCNLCFGVALWNGNDPILKERLFGLTGNEGNHAEDVKELYYYLDSTPTHSYMKHLYKYPQNAFPYADLIETNKKRGRQDPEYELLDTGIFDGNKYFDVITEYAKADDTDILIKITVHNRGKKKAPLVLLPTLWFRNLWSFGLESEKPSIEVVSKHKDYTQLKTHHNYLGDYYFYFEAPERLLFTENETNMERVFGYQTDEPFVKDAINDAVIENDFSVIERKQNGTKCSPLYRFEIDAGKSVSVRLRLSQKEHKKNPLTADFDKHFTARLQEADEFYNALVPKNGNKDLQNIQRQAFAGMMWTKQYYNLDITRWLNGDPGQPDPPPQRKKGRNNNWHNLANEDIVSMPDKWEYPWYAAWDSAFHCIPLALIDAEFAKKQLILFLREWYMHPNGQIPAYEWAFSDVNPPVHAWACIEVYRLEERQTGKRDVDFLKRVFQKLLINFTWWVNRKDSNDNNIFEGGFLGLDNIGIFDRSAPIPGGGHLEQADGTAWMAMYCLNMLDIALEIAQFDPTFEDVATKFFEHFIIITESLNQIGEDWVGAWDEEDGFFYDILAMPGGKYMPLKVRSLVGLTTMFATLRLERTRLENLPDFKRRLEWYRKYREDNKLYLVIEDMAADKDILLSLLPNERLKKMLKALLDEQEFLSPYGIRSLSKIHETPYVVNIEGQEFGLKYEPAESTIGLFGGNSNWRGPVWMPMNFLIIESLRQFHQYFEDTFKVECPTDSGNYMTLDEVADEISKRLTSLFQADAAGRRPIHGEDPVYQTDPHFKNLILFYEYFHGCNGRGVGAAHQTGWTGVVAELIHRVGWKK